MQLMGAGTKKWLNFRPCGQMIRDYINSTVGLGCNEETSILLRSLVRRSQWEASQHIAYFCQAVAGYHCLSFGNVADLHGDLYLSQKNKATTLAVLIFVDFLVEG